MSDLRSAKAVVGGGGAGRWSSLRVAGAAVVAFLARSAGRPGDGGAAGVAGVADGAGGGGDGDAGCVRGSDAVTSVFARAKAGAGGAAAVSGGAAAGGAGAGCCATSVRGLELRREASWRPRRRPRAWWSAPAVRGGSRRLRRRRGGRRGGQRAAHRRPGPAAAPGASGRPRPAPVQRRLSRNPHADRRLRVMLLAQLAAAGGRPLVPPPLPAAAAAASAQPAAAEPAAQSALPTAPSTPPSAVVLPSSTPPPPTSTISSPNSAAVDLSPAAADGAKLGAAFGASPKAVAFNVPVVQTAPKAPLRPDTPANFGPTTAKPAAQPTADLTVSPVALGDDFASSPLPPPSARERVVDAAVRGLLSDVPCELRESAEALNFRCVEAEADGQVIFLAVGGGAGGGACGGAAAGGASLGGGGAFAAFGGSHASGAASGAVSGAAFSTLLSLLGVLSEASLPPVPGVLFLPLFDAPGRQRLAAAVRQRLAAASAAGDRVTAQLCAEAVQFLAANPGWTQAGGAPGVRGGLQQLAMLIVAAPAGGPEGGADMGGAQGGTGPSVPGNGAGPGPGPGAGRGPDRGPRHCSCCSPLPPLPGAANALEYFSKQLPSDYVGLDLYPPPMKTLQQLLGIGGM